jgi:two-component system LytT family response regulator
MAERPPIRVLIVDDEPLARQRLEDLLGGENGVEIVASVDNGEAAVDAVRSLHPDIAFLDVQMPGKTGIDVVREVGPEAMPLTIFVTAYDRYALQAFDLAAVDYLVKPFDDERFEQAFQRARRYVELEEMESSRATALGSTAARAAPSSAPAVPTSPGSLVSRAHRRRCVARSAWFPSRVIEYITASGPTSSCTPASERISSAKRFTRSRRSSIPIGSSASTARSSYGWISSTPFIAVPEATTRSSSRAARACASAARAARSWNDGWASRAEFGLLLFRPYESRKSVIGSTRDALSAGTSAESPATTPSIAGAATV